MANCKTLGLDLEILRRVCKDRLIRILEDASGPKDLIIDSDLMKLLDRVADAKILREHGANKMYRLEQNAPLITCNTVFYLVRPTKHNVKNVISQITNLRKNYSSVSCHIVCTPRTTFWVNFFIERDGLHGLVALHEFHTEFIPLDDDLLSLEMTYFFKEVFVDNDYSNCVSVAQSLHTLQSLYGRIPNICSHGRAANAVMNALKVFTQTEKKSKQMQNPEIGHLFIFDRDADYVCTLLTQLTYEGSLDEHFGIKAGVVEFPKEVVNLEKSIKVPLNSKDTVFDNIRNRHFAGVANYLARRVKELQSKRQMTSSMNPLQIKEFVANELRTLQELQKSLSLHLSACEHINKNTKKDFDVHLQTEHGLVTNAIGGSDAMNYIEECIARQFPSTMNLRLLCLYSLTKNGLSRKEYESIATRVFHAHGYHNIASLTNLQKMDMLQVEYGREGARAAGNTGGTSANDKQKHLLQQFATTLGVKSSSNFKLLSRKLNLIPNADQHINLHNPSHISYVFNGAYSPLIPQLVSDALTKGYKSICDALKLIPGTSLIDTHIVPSSPPRVAFVLILGGLTYAEVAAFRLISVMLSTRIIIASTNTTTGSNLIQAAFVT